jgi:hypothetical protein
MVCPLPQNRQSGLVARYHKRTLPRMRFFCVCCLAFPFMGGPSVEGFMPCRVLVTGRPTRSVPPAILVDGGGSLLHKESANDSNC